MSERRHPNVVNLAELATTSRDQGRFAFKRRMLGSATGARGLGCSWIEVQPGQVAFPNHYHCANEEALFVLSGTGELRIGDTTVVVGPGDYATFGIGPEGAHQLMATGDEPLRYLCLSTMVWPEVVGYPDSDKVGAIAVPPGKGREDAWIAKWFRAGDEVDYFEGEDP